MRKILREVEGSAALVGVALLSASFGLITRYLGDVWSDEAQTVSRFGVALALFWLAWLMGKRVRLHGRIRNIALAIGPIYLSTGLFFTYGVQRTTIANVLFMFFGGSIVFSFLLANFVLKESVSSQKLASIVLALVGIGMYSQAIFTVNLGVLAGLAGGLCDALATVARKKIVHEDRTAVLAYQYASGVAVMAIIMILAGGPYVRDLTLGAAILTIVYGVGLFGVGYLLMAGFKRVDANIGTVLVALEIVFAPLLAWLFLNEIPAGHELVGGLCIALAAVLSGVKYKKKKAIGVAA